MARTAGVESMQILKVVLSAVLLASPPALVGAQEAGRAPAAGTTTTGGSTIINNENRVTASGTLHLWQAWAGNGGRAMLKIYRPEGSRLVLVGSSALESIQPNQVNTFACSIPVARNDVIGVYCPDANCIDRFADGQVLTIGGDVGTESTAAFVSGSGAPAIFAGSSASFAVPSSASRNLVVPVVARNPGENDTMWITSLEIFNTSGIEAEAALLFNLSGADNTIPQASAQVLIPPRGVAVFEDLFDDVFGLQIASGSVDIVASAPLIAHARIANIGTGTGSFGQLVRAFPVEWAFGDDDAPGVNDNADIAYFFEVRESSEWRSNLGVTNISGVKLRVVLTAFTGTTRVGEDLTLELEPYSHLQLNHLLDILEVSPGTQRVRVNVAAEAGAAGRFLAYLSRIDNTTGDAVYFPGTREPSL